jgi:ferric iron reductase protein FhuF
MTPDIDALLTGPLSFAHGYLALVPGDGEAIRGAKLRRPEVLRGLLDRYCLQFGKADRRAGVSMWMQSYAVRLVYPVLAANLMAGRDLPLALDDVTLLVGPEGGPRGFVLPHAGGAITARGMARFAPLVRDHLAPLIEALAAADRITPRLAWSNAGIRISGTADIARRAGRLDAEAAEDVALLLGSTCWPDGWLNPVFEPYRVPHGGGEAQRRVCCLRYLLPGFAGCGDACPVPGGRGLALEAA